MSDTIYSKFIAARGAVKNPPLDSTNPHFKNRYASLAATLDEVNAACARNGITYVQALCADGEFFRLCSFVMDGEGNRIELSQFPVTNVPNPQNFGSEMTYKKRQQAQADWGIVGEEDDDGEGAAKQYRPEPKRRQPEQTRGQTKSDRAVEAAIRAKEQREAAKAQRDSRLDDVRGLYKAATDAGVRAEGIEAWFNAEFGKALSEIGTLETPQLYAFSEYLKGVTRDAQNLRMAHETAAKAAEQVA